MADEQDLNTGQIENLVKMGEIFRTVSDSLDANAVRLYAALVDEVKKGKIKNEDLTNLVSTLHQNIIKLSKDKDGNPQKIDKDKMTELIQGVAPSDQITEIINKTLPSTLGDKFIATGAISELGKELLDLIDLKDKLSDSTFDLSDNLKAIFNDVESLQKAAQTLGETNLIDMSLVPELNALSKGFTSYKDQYTKLVNFNLKYPNAITFEGAPISEAYSKLSNMLTGLKKDFKSVHDTVNKIDLSKFIEDANADIDLFTKKIKGYENDLNEIKNTKWDHLKLEYTAEIKKLQEQIKEKKEKIETVKELNIKFLELNTITDSLSGKLETEVVVDTSGLMQSLSAAEKTIDLTLNQQLRNVRTIMPVWAQGILNIEKRYSELSKGISSGFEAARLEIAKSGNLLEAKKKFMEKLRGPLTAITSPWFIIGIAIFSAFMLLRQFENSLKQITQDLGVSRAQAKGIYEESLKIVNAWDNNYTTLQDINDVLKVQRERYGTILDLTDESNKRMINTAAALSKQFGIATSEINQMQSAFIDIGADSKLASQLSAALADAAQLSGIPFGNIVKDLNESSAEIAMYFNGMPKEAAKAVIEIRRLGMSMKQIGGIMEKSLDIGAFYADLTEINLMSGGQVDLSDLIDIRFDPNLTPGERMEKLASRIAEEYDRAEASGSNTEFLQRKMAQTLGISVEELQRQHKARQAIAKLEREGLHLTDEQKNLIMERGDLFSDEHLANSDLLQQQIKQHDTQERMNIAMQQMKTQFVEAILPAMELFADIFNALVPIIKVIGWLLKGIGIVITGFLTPLSIISDTWNGSLSLTRLWNDELHIGYNILRGIGILLGTAYIIRRAILLTNKLSLKWLGKEFVIRKKSWFLDKLSFKWLGKKLGLQRSKNVAVGVEEATKRKSWLLDKAQVVQEKLKYAWQKARLALLGKEATAKKTASAAGSTGGVGNAGKATSGLGKGAGAMIKGAAAMLIVAAAIWIFAAAIQELEKIEDWGKVAVGLGLFAASIGLLAAVGTIAGPGLTALGVALNAFGAAMLTGVGAIGLAALIVTAIALAFALNLAAPAIEAFGVMIEKIFNGLATVLEAAANGINLIVETLSGLSVGQLIKIGVGLLILGKSLAIFGKTILVGLPGIVLFGAALAVLMPVLDSLGDIFGKFIDKINEIDTSNFIEFSKGLIILSGGLIALSVASLLLGKSAGLIIAAAGVLFILGTALMFLMDPMQTFTDFFEKLSNLDLSSLPNISLTLYSLTGALAALLFTPGKGKTIRFLDNLTHQFKQLITVVNPLTQLSNSIGSLAENLINLESVLNGLNLSNINIDNLKFDNLLDNLKELKKLDLSSTIQIKTVNPESSITSRTVEVLANEIAPTLQRQEALTAQNVEIIKEFTNYIKKEDEGLFNSNQQNENYKLINEIRELKKVMTEYLGNPIIVKLGDMELKKVASKINAINQ